jgi:AcrR family transcriptional regulator
LDAAVSQLRSGGYEALSVAGVARELGLAQNAVYWYFSTRDDLLIAAVDATAASALAAKPGRGPAVDEIIRFVDRLSAIQWVIDGLYMRSRVSPTVAAYEARLRERITSLLADVIATEYGQVRARRAAVAMVCTIDGALLLHLPTRQRNRVIRDMFAALAASSGRQSAQS